MSFKFLIIVYLLLSVLRLNAQDNDIKQSQEFSKVSTAESYWIVTNAMPFEKFALAANELKNNLNEKYSGKKIFKFINSNSASYSKDLFSGDDKILMMSGVIDESLISSTSGLILSYNIQILILDEKEDLKLGQGSTHILTSVKDMTEAKETILKSIETVLYINDKIAKR